MLNSKIFYEKFKLSNEIYSSFTELIDVKSGFSVQRDYPLDIDFSPAKTKSGKFDEVCLIHVWIPNDQSDSSNKIYIRISLFSKWISTYPNYNFEDENCPTHESLMRSKEGNRPRSLAYEGEFIDGDTFQINIENEVYFPADFLELIFKEHLFGIRSTKQEEPLKSFWIEQLA